LRKQREEEIEPRLGSSWSSDDDDVSDWEDGYESRFRRHLRELRKATRRTRSAIDHIAYAQHLARSKEIDSGLRNLWSSDDDEITDSDDEYVAERQPKLRGQQKGRKPRQFWYGPDGPSEEAVQAFWGKLRTTWWHMMGDRKSETEADDESDESDNELMMEDELDQDLDRDQASCTCGNCEICLPEMHVCPLSFASGDINLYDYLTTNLPKDRHLSDSELVNVANFRKIARLTFAALRKLTRF
jgi:hypothetical protein